MSRDEPERGIVFSAYLTRDEWRMVYAYAWVARVMRCYGLEEVDDALFEKMTNDEGLAMLWATRKLALKHGMTFRAVAVDPDYRVRLTQVEPVIEYDATGKPVRGASLILLDKLARGKGLQYHRLLEFAIGYALSRGLKDFDFEPMREALARINEDLSAHRKERTPEDDELIDKSMEYLLRIAGLQRADKPIRGDN